MDSLAPTRPFRQAGRRLIGWKALLGADLVALSKSWVLRGWIVALALTTFFGLASMLTRGDPAGISAGPPGSVVLAQQLDAYLLIWSTVIIVLSAGSVSLESDIVADSILSRACTRTEYILAKIASRALTIGGIYLVFAGAAAYAVRRYGVNDMTAGSVASGIAIVGMAILLIVALGTAMSTIFNNTIVSVIGLLLLWYVAGTVFNFVGAQYLSPASLMENLPKVLKDSDPPEVARCAATETSVTVLFTKPVDRYKAEEVADYTVVPEGKAVETPGTAIYDAGKRSVLLGGLRLAPGSTVQVIVRGVTDTAGNPISAAADRAAATVPGRRVRPVARRKKPHLAPAKVTEGAGGTRATDGGRRDYRPPTSGTTSGPPGYVPSGYRQPGYGTPGSPRPGGWDDPSPPRVIGGSATDSTARIIFSKAVKAKDAERIENYVVESPVGTPHTARAASYNADSRTALLSGLELPSGDPVKITVRNVRDLRGVPIDARYNSASYSKVIVWKYIAGFGLPALLSVLLAAGWFSKKDL